MLEVVPTRYASNQANESNIAMTGPQHAEKKTENRMSLPGFYAGVLV